MHCVDNCSIKEVSQKFLLSTGVITAAKPILESNGTGAVQSDCRYTYTYRVICSQSLLRNLRFRLDEMTVKCFKIYHICGIGKPLYS